jgi:hypothetical protein
LRLYGVDGDQGPIRIILKLFLFCRCSADGELPGAAERRCSNFILLLAVLVWMRESESPPPQVGSGKY